MEKDRATCWTMIRAAASGEEEERRRFARAYLPVIRAYLGARWRGTRHLAELDDAVQDAFLDCLKENGALTRVDPSRNVKFRTFLFGVVRNVALRHEERRARERARRQTGSRVLEDLEVQEDRLSRIFDRAWARSLIRQAAARQEEHARVTGEAAMRRVRLLDLRFRAGKPIRDIAREWDEDPAHLHREYAKAREEFKRCLREEVAFHHPGDAGQVERECAALLGLLG